jgi:hypothetical protein
MMIVDGITSTDFQAWAVSKWKFTHATESKCPSKWTNYSYFILYVFQDDTKISLLFVKMPFSRNDYKKSTTCWALKRNFVYVQSKEWMRMKINPFVLRLIQGYCQSWKFNERPTTSQANGNIENFSILLFLF